MPLVFSGLNTKGSFNLVYTPPPPPPAGLFSWGQGTFGKLGLGNTTYYSSPKQVGSLTNWKNIAAGGFSGYSIKTDGTFWSWGRNGYGRLGLSDTTDRPSPVQIDSLPTWLNVSAGVNHSMAIG